LKNPQVLNIFLSQCLSAEGENPMVRHNQLPEWQKNSLSRPPHSIQLILCQTRKNQTQKRPFWRAAEEADLSKQGLRT
jgi:hypothetical protein